MPSYWVVSLVCCLLLPLFPNSTAVSAQARLSRSEGSMGGPSGAGRPSGRYPPGSRTRARGFKGPTGWCTATWTSAKQCRLQIQAGQPREGVVRRVAPMQPPTRRITGKRRPPVPWQLSLVDSPQLQLLESPIQQSETLRLVAPGVSATMFQSEALQDAQTTEALPITITDLELQQLAESEEYTSSMASRTMMETTHTLGSPSRTLYGHNRPAPSTPPAAKRTRHHSSPVSVAVSVSPLRLTRSLVKATALKDQAETKEHSCTHHPCIP